MKTKEAEIYANVQEMKNAIAVQTAKTRTIDDLIAALSIFTEFL